MGQKEANIWYFGKNAGVNFNNNPPTPITNSMVHTLEGSASICDEKGNLLLYTDGINVWNKNHSIMPNGYGLNGHLSSSQSSMVVKKPNSDSLYYIFTTDAIAGIEGFCYSIVDISLQNGLGDINNSKNISLISPSDEKITAVKHKNGIDFWIITHIYASNTFYCYLLTEDGLQTTPVINNIGTITYSPVGYMKSSSNGKYIAVANYSQNIQVFNFDNSTGILSSPLTIPYFGKPYYGVEFSPNNNILYASEVDDLLLTHISQFNLNAGLVNDIIDSRIVIGVHFGPGGALQLAPDDKIYHARFFETHLGVIQNPNFLGTNCNYIGDGFYLGGRISTLGLPSLLYSSVNLNLGDDIILCKGDKLTLDATTPNATHYLWHDGTTNSTYDLDKPGTYSVSVTINGTIIKDSIRVEYYIDPIIDFGEDKIVCRIDSTILQSPAMGMDFVWQDGSTDSIFIAREDGIYWIEVSYEKCKLRDSVKVKFRGCNTIPNVITPNNDGINDQFVIDMPNEDKLKLQIYNRWGSMVYESSDYKNNWQADDLPDGTYYYILYNEYNNSPEEHKGWIEVMR